MSQVFPLFPIRGRVTFPGLVYRFKVGKKSTVKLIEEKFPKIPTDEKSNPNPSPSIVLVTIKNELVEEPTQEDLYDYGCTARVLRVLRSTESDSKYILVVEAVSRAKVDEIIQTTPYLTAKCEIFKEPNSTKQDKELEQLTAALRNTGNDFLDVLKELQLPTPTVNQMRKFVDTLPATHVADLLISTTDAEITEKMEVLRAYEAKERLRKSTDLLKKQTKILGVAQKVSSTVDSKLSKKQRELYLRQQLKAIKDELGEKEDSQEDEIGELQKKIESLNLNEEVEKIVDKEIKRLKKTHPSQAEYGVIRTYLEWISDLPWNNSTKDYLEIEKARAKLDADHFGLEKIKKRILEYLSVRKLKKDLKGPILCFIGPPGVGKTSLGLSIAEALGRKFHRISLGGVHDEAEIRGHRRTYIGALPGKIVQALRKVGVNNPVFLLDEIDKLGKDVRGDPASAMLEVLDPEQNGTFTDHYLNLPVDLSKILFIATANSSDTIPPALLDRMEVIRLPGYTMDEKIEIAKRHLVSKQLKAHGIENEGVSFTDEAMMKIVTDYTREAGVRSLEREIASICRSVAVEIAEKGDTKKMVTISLDKVVEVLGPEYYQEDSDERVSLPGVSIGLAWTSSGSGGVLYIEATKMPGSGRLTLTGQLGDVMKESAQTALSWIRTNASRIGLPSYETSSLLDKTDIHIHFPAGAIPKDGPSAGITIVSAIYSLLSGQTLLPKTAMTGEITLSGLVLPVGGIKEKVLAAHRAGMKKVILPFKNKKDIIDIPEKVQHDIKLVWVKNITEVLSNAFEPDSLPFIETRSRL